MGSIYLPATLDTPRKEIARYEGGYIRNVYGTCIGRYDNKYIYEGSSSINADHIGTISFNYGYLRSSNDIFVTSYKDGSLSVTGNRYFAYFDDDDQIGAIAAFIVCYKKDMFTLPVNNNSSIGTPKTSSNFTSSFSSRTNDYPSAESSGGEGGCLAAIGISLAIILFITAFFYASGAIWIEMFKSLFTGQEILELWVIIIPIAGIIIGNIAQSHEHKKNIFDIAELYLLSFAVPIFVISVICAIIKSSFIGFFIVFLGSAIICAIPLIITVLVAYFMEKSK